MVALLLIFTSSALLQAFLDGARGLIGTILLLAIYQFIFLYALRKLYEEEPLAEPPDPLRQAA